MKSLPIIGFSLLFALFIFPGLSAAPGNNHTIRKSFDVNEGGTLNLESDLGSIQIDTHPAKTVVVEVIREVRSSAKDKEKDVLKRFTVSFDQRGDEIEIVGDYERSWHFGRNPLKVRFIVTVPKKFNVNLKTSGGSISVDDLQGRVDAKTSGGSLNFGNIDGPLWGKTSGGSISLEDCRGNASVKTSGGSIHIGQVSGDVEAFTSGGTITIKEAQGNVTAKTSGGSIKVKEVAGTINASTSGGSVIAHISRQPESDCSLQTSGGNVEVYLGGGIAVDVDAGTSSGRVECDFDVTVRGKMKKNKLQGKINGGGPELFLRTSGGNVKILKM